MNKSKGILYIVVATMWLGSGSALAEADRSLPGQELGKKSGSTGKLGQDHKTKGESPSGTSGGANGSGKQERGASGNIGRPDQPKAAGEGTLSGPARVPESNRSTTGRESSSEGTTGSGSGSIGSGGTGSSGGGY